MENLFISERLLHFFKIKKNLPSCKKIFLVTKLCFVANAGWAQVIAWDFDKGTNGGDSPSIITANVTAGNLSQGNNNGTTPLLTITSASSGYTNSSGNFNAGIAPFSQPFNLSSSTYFEFTLTPDPGYSLSINSIKFGSRSTGTGPQAFSIRTSVDSYNSELAGGVFPVDSKWYLYQLSSNTVSSVNAITIRIYGFNGAGGNQSIATWRIDDLSLNVTAAPFKSSMRSRQNGNWSQLTTWESSTDNINWNISSSVPSKDIEEILIQPAHTVTISTPVSMDQITVAGVLEVQNGGILNINNGEGDDINIVENGVLKITSSADYSTSVFQAANASINISKNGKITVGNGVTLAGKGYETFATSLMNKWNDASVFEYNNNAAFQIANLIYFPNATSAEIPIFRVSKMIGAAAAGTGNDFYLNGLLEVNSNISFSGVGKKYFRNGIRGNETLSQTGTGKFILTAANAVLEGSSLKIILSATMDLSPSAFVPLGAYVTVSGANINNNIAGNVFTINGTLDVVSNGIGNLNGSVIVNGTFRTSHPGGFSGGGSSIVSGNITLNPGSIVELYAEGNQNLNSRKDFYNLIISGSGTKKPLGPFIPLESVTIKDNAVFDCSSQNIGDDNIPTNLTMTGNSRLIVGNTGTNPKMSGAYNLSGGVIEFNGSNLTPQTIRNRNYQNIEVTGNNVLMSIGNIGLNSNGSFVIKNGGIFSINDNTIIGDGSGTQTVVVQSGGTLKCGTNLGFNGAKISAFPMQSSAINQDIKRITLETGSTVEYSRNGDQPITNENGLIYQNLILSGTGNKTAPSDDLIIQGNFSKTSPATFIHNNGTVIFNGNNSQNYSCVSPQIIFNNLTNQNISGLYVNDSLAVYKRLLLDNNSTLNLIADISLRSDKNQTSYISKLGANAKINYFNGRFIVERYINTNTQNGGHEKSWQLIATPAFGETIFNTWQEKGNKTISGYGTWITGNSISNGFDAFSPAPAMKYYDDVSNNWVGISNTNLNLENEKGYMIFIRGDRLSTNPNSPPNPTVLRTRGKLYVGEFLPPKSIVNAGKFQSVGNPYASAIDFSKINRINTGNYYIAWDPTLGGSFGFGGFQTISPVTNYRAVPGNTANYNSNSDYRNIQSGQAFFIYNPTSAPGSVSFTEDCKLDEGNHLVTKEIMPKRQMLFAHLFSQNGIMADGNVVVFDEQFSNKIDGNDALKINNGAENFSIKNTEKIFAIEARENIKILDTIFYYLKNLSKQEYKLVFTPQEFEQEVEAILIDEYLKNETQINLNDTSGIAFSVNADPTSSNPERFYLIFQRKIKERAPAVFSFDAHQQNANVFLEWKIGIDTKQLIIEHSSDAINFSAIKTFDDITPFESTYLHNQPLNGDNYYRLAKVDNEGKIEYSEIVKVVMQNVSRGIYLSQYSIENKKVMLQFIDEPAGRYFIKIYNSTGQILLKKEVFHTGGSSVKAFDFINDSHQIYYLQILKTHGEKTILKILK
ncbi:MAG TPA: hypothetical protein VN722_07970 [Hanamia sp.]|nr:hypothetical protein [Hanamia sp.]